MRRTSADRIAFVLSVAVLAYVYGYATQRFDLFPNRFLERAVRQAMVAGSSTEGRLPAYTAPRHHHWQGVRATDPDGVERGLTLISSVWEGSSWTPGVRLIDLQGNALHDWRIDPVEVFSESGGGRRGLSAAAQRSVHGSYLFENGDVLVNVDYVGTARLDACGQVLWKLQEGNHHSIARADDGAFWIPGVSAEPRRESPDHPDGLPGIDGPVYQDRILKVSADGKVLTKINVLDILYENDLERHLFKGGRRYGNDPVHLNDVEPLSRSMADEYPLFEAGDLLVSLRNIDMVLVLDPDSREVRWHTSEPFILQHDPDFVGDGWIGVFDNNVDGTDRGTILGGSRIVFVRPHTNTRNVRFPTSISETFYTHSQGKWQLLVNGNMLLTEAQAGRVMEVGPDGNTVWEWVAPPYNESTVPEVSGASRYDLTSQEVASWPCSPDEAAEQIPQPEDDG